MQRPLLTILRAWHERFVQCATPTSPFVETQQTELDRNDHRTTATLRSIANERQLMASHNLRRINSVEIDDFSDDDDNHKAANTKTLN